MFSEWKEAVETHIARPLSRDAKQLFKTTDHLFIYLLTYRLILYHFSLLFLGSYASSQVKQWLMSHFNFLKKLFEDLSQHFFSNYTEPQHNIFWQHLHPHDVTIISFFSLWMSQILSVLRCTGVKAISSPILTPSKDTLKVSEIWQILSYISWGEIKD